MDSSDWMEQLQMLVARFPEYGVEADLSSMSKIDLWGTYLRLSRLVNG